jgi:hypothetical protein
VGSLPNLCLRGLVLDDGGGYPYHGALLLDDHRDVTVLVDASDGRPRVAEADAAAD